MDLAAREALATLIRDEVRTELAADFDAIAIELEELRLRMDVLETLAERPDRAPRRCSARQREAARMRDQGDSLNRIAGELRVSHSTVKADLARERAVARIPIRADNGQAPEPVTGRDKSERGGSFAPPAPPEWPLTAGTPTAARVESGVVKLNSSRPPS